MHLCPILKDFSKYYTKFFFYTALFSLLPQMQNFPKSFFWRCKINIQSLTFYFVFFLYFRYKILKKKICTHKNLTIKNIKNISQEKDHSVTLSFFFHLESTSTLSINNNQWISIKLATPLLRTCVFSCFLFFQRSSKIKLNYLWKRLKGSSGCLNPCESDYISICYDRPFITTAILTVNFYSLSLHKCDSRQNDNFSKVRDLFVIHYPVQLYFNYMDADTEKCLETKYLVWLPVKSLQQSCVLVFSFFFSWQLWFLQ